MAGEFPESSNISDAPYTAGGRRTLGGTVVCGYNTGVDVKRVGNISGEAIEDE